MNHEEEAFNLIAQAVDVARAINDREFAISELNGLIQQARRLRDDMESYGEVMDDATLRALAHTKNGMRGGAE